jgi:DNA-binding NtrC family response regulator
MSRATRSRKILVVDDDVDTTTLMCEALRIRGFDAVGLNSGYECLAWLEADVADAVVTDVQMPGMTGLELLAGLKQTYPSLPVVVVTGFTNNTLSDARRLGAFEVAHKPVRIDVLANILDRAIRGT